MNVKIRVCLSDALATGIEPGVHTIEVPLVDLDAAQRELLGNCLEYMGFEYWLSRASLLPDNRSSSCSVAVPCPKELSCAGLLESLQQVPAMLQEFRCKQRDQLMQDITSVASGKQVYIDPVLLQLFPEFEERYNFILEELKKDKIAKGMPEAERLRKQGHLDIEDGKVRYLSNSQDTNILEVLGPEYYKLLDKAQEIVDAGRQSIVSQCESSQADWLRQNGGIELLKKIEAGYPCRDSLQRLVFSKSLELVESLAYSLDFKLTVVVPSTVLHCDSPSDNAFKLATEVGKMGFSAEIVTAFWEMDGGYSKEMVQISVPCPWDSSIEKYLVLRLVRD